jgi:serine/threonine protein phosphatase PrpC
VLQYPANSPIEDRFNVSGLKSIDGFTASVFDGHGGWQIADYAMKKINVYLDEELKGNRSPKSSDIINAIKKSYDRIVRHEFLISRKKIA